MASPFVGFEGIVRRKRKIKTRLIPEIKAIGQAVGIEISINQTLPT